MTCATNVTPASVCVEASATRAISVSFDDMLKSSESLTGTPTVTFSPTGPTAGSVARNSSSLTFEDGTVVTANRAVQFTFSGGTAGFAYRFEVSCATDSTPAQTLIAWGYIEVVG